MSIDHRTEILKLGGQFTLSTPLITQLSWHHRLLSEKNRLKFYLFYSGEISNLSVSPESCASVCLRLV